VSSHPEHKCDRPPGWRATPSPPSSTPPGSALIKVQRHGGSVLKALYRSAICPFGKPPLHPVPAATATAPTHSPRITRLQEEMRFKVLHALQQQPDMNQRQLAELLGVSLGKTNYLLRALVDKGLLKARNFRNSQNKLAYAYLLTPSGMAQKAELTRAYWSALEAYAKAAFRFRSRNRWGPSSIRAAPAGSQWLGSRTEDSVFLCFLSKS